MTILKLIVSKPRTPIFQRLSSQKYSVQKASPKNGKFIDWNFTCAILGDANWVLIAFFLNMRIFVVASYNRQLLIILCELYDFMV